MATHPGGHLGPQHYIHIFLLLGNKVLNNGIYKRNHLETSIRIAYAKVIISRITWISGSATTNCFNIRLPKARDIAKTPPTLQVPENESTQGF